MVAAVREIAAAVVASRCVVDAAVAEDVVVAVVGDHEDDNFFLRSHWSISARGVFRARFSCFSDRYVKPRKLNIDRF